MKIKPSEITPEHIYISRRNFIRNTSALAASAALASACTGIQAHTTPNNPAQTTDPQQPTSGAAASPTPTATNTTTIPIQTPSARTDELGAPLTSYEAITSFINYYEFTTSKRGVAELAKGFKTSPWTVEVGGMAARPRTFDLEDILRKFTQEERIYRMRCVEAWSMVIPWQGFPLALLLKEVEPTSKAKYVRFETLYDPEQMPDQKSPSFKWPYVEGLRLDEAMHDLTILATGIYGKPLLPQNGAPIRLVVPWKYGFKNIKSIVKIELVEEMPVSLWMAALPGEYGFYATVNPDAPHPRWSQEYEQRIEEKDRRRTLLFNGYTSQVSSLYPGTLRGYY
jgi:sulfoxide reductase catalytic subunit YedY